MKNFYMVQGLDSDVAVVWDVDEETFIISVASNRLPEVPLPNPTENIQKMAQYFEAVRLQMKPIGKSHDGATEKRQSLEQALSFLHELEDQGYRLPLSWESHLKSKVATQKDKKEKSWALQKQSLQQHAKATKAPKKKKSPTIKKGS